MPLTTGSATFTGTGITVQCGTREIYDRVKAEEAVRGVYTLTGEDIPNLTLTFSTNRTISLNTGLLP
jgi:hypothetical protein